MTYWLAAVWMRGGVPSSAGMHGCLPAELVVKYL